VHISRCVAESVKTLSWQYVMKSKKSLHRDEDSELKLAFKKILFEASLLNKVPNLNHAGLEITSSMKDIRAMPLDVKIRIYKTDRVLNQLGWYVQKASSNANKKMFFSFLCLFLYSVGLFISARQYFEYNASLQWVTEPILVMAACTLAWTQGKKHNELSTSYQVATNEIKELVEEIDNVNSNDELIDYIEIAESTFSKEHTHWAMRRK